MRYSILTTMGVLMIHGLLAQAGRLVINDDAFIVIDNNAKLVVGNPSTNAITSLGSGANMITESEFDQVVWNIGTSTGTYVMPFSTQTTFTKIPFTANITAAGSGSGVVFFSTYPGATWDNNTYRPSDVTHMFDYNTNTINNSGHVIDRFWIIDASGYGTKPTATFQFTYRDAEHLQVGNTIVESDLGAQRFNSSTNHWGDYLPAGSTNAGTNTTSNVPVSPANFFRSWTLSEVTNPLSAELAYLQSSCNGSTIVLNWTTLSENNTDHFEIEYYQDGQFVVTGFIQATGSGADGASYTFIPGIEREGVFRLVEVDTDGNRSEKSTISALCSGTDDVVVSYSNGTLLLAFDGAVESAELLQLFDAAGKLVQQRTIAIENGTNTILIPDLYLSNGMYMVRMKNGFHQISEKIIATE